MGKDPFEVASRFAAASGGVRRFAARLESGLAGVSLAFFGTFVLMAGWVVAVAVSSVWGSVLLAASVVLMFSALFATFAFSMFEVAEVRVVPALLRWRGVPVASVSLASVARALRRSVLGFSPFRSSRFVTGVDVSAVVAPMVLSTVARFGGGERLLELFSALGSRQDLLGDPDVRASDAAAALEALDVLRFSLLLPLAFIAASRVGWGSSGGPAPAVGKGSLLAGEVLRLASDLEGMTDHQVGFCLSLLGSARWDGSVDDLLHVARRVSV